MKKNQLLKLIFFLCGALLLIFKLTVSQGGHVDEIFFKAPGLNWAIDNGWCSPEETGFGGWSPPLDEVFASYPPLYPFFFGLFVKLFGFGWRVCAGYDAGIHVALAFVLVHFIRLAVPARPHVGWVIGILFLFTAYPARPDRLAMIFGYFSLALLLCDGPKLPVRRYAGSGMLFGFCMGTSIPCALALSPMFAALIWHADKNIKVAATRLIVAAATTGITFLVIVLPVLWFHADAWKQNLSATRHVTSFAFLSSLTHLFRYHSLSLVLLLLLLLPGIFVFLRLLKARREIGFSQWFFWYGSACFTLAFFMIKSTFQGYYHWFFIPWFAAALFQSNLCQFWSRRTALFWVAVSLIPALAFNVRTMLAALVTKHERRVSSFSALVESQVPEGASVLCTAEYWWLLASRNHVYDIMNHGVMDVERIQYIILTGCGTGAPNTHQPLPPFANHGDYELISSSLAQDVPSIFGIPLTRSSTSPAPVIFRRIEAK
jgi:hypothetical protein